MKTTFARRLSAILVLVALIAVAGVALSEEDGRFYAIDALESLGFELAPHEGKVIVINYFTTWCFYCAQEMPDFKKAYETYSPDEMQMVFVHVWDGETGDATAGFIEKHGLEEMTVVEDEHRVMAGGVGIPGYPTTLILDKQGYLTYAIPQAMPYEALSGFLDELGVMKAAPEEAI